MPDTILRLPAVRARTGLSRSQIYLLIQRGQFPAQIPLGPNSAGWLESEVDAWIADRAAQRSERKAVSR